MLGVNLIADDHHVENVFFNKYIFCSLPAFWQSCCIWLLYHLAALFSSYVHTHMVQSLVVRVVQRRHTTYRARGSNPRPGSAPTHLLKANVLHRLAALTHRQRIHAKLITIKLQFPESLGKLEASFLLRYCQLVLRSGRGLLEGPSPGTVHLFIIEPPHPHSYLLSSTHIHHLPCTRSSQTLPFLRTQFIQLRGGG